MDSVYFGKETSIKINPETIDSEKKDRVREYYFPDENNKKIKVLEFFSALFSSAVLDFLLLGILMPLLILNLELFYKELSFIGLISFYISSIVFIYFIIFTLLYLLIHNSGRRYVYVNDNGTFYFIKKTIRVNTHKKGIFISKEKANAKINAKYAKQINKINNLIDKKAFSVRKTLTDCKESDDIHENGLYFTGYNEAKLNDEEFRIPETYVKYEAGADYYSPNSLPKFLLFLIKFALYGGIFLFLFNTVNKKLALYEANVSAYIEEKSAILNSYGFEYYESPYDYARQYDYVEFTTDDYLRNSIRFYYDFNEDGKFEDDSIFIDFDLYMDDDTDYLIPLVRDIYGGELPDENLIIDLINEYKEDPTDKKTETRSNDNTYFSVTVHESYWADYDITIYISDYHNNRSIF